ncbi:glyoxylate/hydroxypyruvate reductase A [Burkholderiaceae bacterium DAT-1]|nr:glyoxylate/hydroxypyruvate reductase A [Burkholderiaceae bacterium DAT-1]
MIIPFLVSHENSQLPAWLNGWLSPLRQAMPDEQIVPFEALSEADKLACEVAIVANPEPAQLAQLPNLKWVHSVWAGVERMLAELPESDLAVVRLVDPRLANTMAEAVLTWALYLHRLGPQYAQQQSQRVWRALEYVRPERRTIGILGMGELGKCTALRLRGAGFRVMGWSRSGTSVPDVETLSGEAGLREMLAQSDIVVCLLPLTAETRGLLNAEQLARMKPGAAIINFARGPIIDEAALWAALDHGSLGYAVLDVFDQEPLPEDAWFWDHPKVTVLPHCSGPTDRESAAQIVAGNIARFRESGDIPPAVDRQRGY